MTAEVDIDERIIAARARCNGCGFDRDGREAAGLAVAHVKETGHTVSVTAATFTLVKPG